MPRPFTYTFETAAGSLELSALGGVDDVSVGEKSTRLRLVGPIPATLRARVSAPERLVGLGERFVRFDQTGRRWEGAITDLLHGEPEDTYCYVPLLYSSAGYGILIESVARCLWDLHATEPGVWSATVADSPVYLHLFRGEPKRILQLATEIIGRPAVPPPWVFGVWKTTLSGSRSVLREADALIREDIPVSACWIYDYYDEDSNSGCGLSGTYSAGEYSDLRKLNRDLHDLGYSTLGYVQPALFDGSRPYEHARGRGYLTRRRDGNVASFPYFNPKLRPQKHGFYEPGAAYVDLTNADARSWYEELLEASLDLGFDGWMQDMGEHITDDVLFADGTTGAAGRNRYAALYHGIAHRVWSQHDAAAVFARSGVLGSIPLVSSVWPGDQHTDWSSSRGLPSVLPAGPTAGLCGVLAWGPDIAGLVAGNDGGDGVSDEELWIRWCQYGALNPIMRDHLGFKEAPRAPVDLWTSERTKSIFRDYSRLHLSLLPYFLRLAEEGAKTGVPIIRALILEYPAHDEAWTIADQYLLGPDLLVAPVHVKDARSRKVWFPPGEWTSWWDDERFEGPAVHEVAAPLEQIPLFRRSDSSIPALDDSGRRVASD